MRAWLRLLLALYPRPFREAFGEGVAEVVLADYRTARRRGRVAALLSLGASTADLVRSAVLEHWRPTWQERTFATSQEGPDMHTVIEQWRRDFVHAIRTLRRSPGFAALATLTLALPIGAAASVFSVVDAVLIHPLPYAHTNQLMYVAGAAPGSQLPAEFGLAQEFLIHYQERSRLIEDIATYNSFTNTLRVGDRAERIRMSAPTYTLFSTLGATPVLGRLATAADEDRVVVISYALWQEWFAGDPSVIGRTVQVGGGSRAIVGVVGPQFRFPTDGTLVWIPVVPRAVGLTPGRFGDDVVARAKPGVTPEQLAAEFTALSRELPGRFGGPPAYGRLIDQFHAVVRPLTEEMLGASSRPLGVLFAAVLMVLVIACANIANLVTVRAEGRRREMAVRQALGARRGQLIRVQLSESLVIAAAAAVLAIVLARVLLPIGVHLAPPNVPRLGDASIDVTTMIFSAAAALVAAVSCGLVPAMRSASPSLLTLRDGSRGATNRRRWGRDALVAAQTALALVLLIGSALLYRSYNTLSRVDAGYRTDDRFTFQIAPEQKSLTDGPSYAAFIMNFMDRLRALPGVESVGVVENIPLDEGTATRRVWTEGTKNEEGTRIPYTFAGESYFSTMAIRVLEGRPFTRDDATTTLGNAVVSKSAARMLWPNVPAIGQRLQLDGFNTWETVIGVVDDVMQDNFRTPPQATIYLPLRGQNPKQYVLDSPAYVVKTKRAETIAPEIRALVHEVAPEAPMYRAFTMAFLADRQMRDLTFTTLTVGLVSILALILGAVGLYGALAYLVAERTREIGVRIALGAQASRVRWMVVGQGVQVVLAGVVVGLIAARFSARALDKLVYGISPVDWATFAAVAGTMVAIGVLASYLPARRASSVDPIVSLRAN